MCLIIFFRNFKYKTQTHLALCSGAVWMELPCLNRSNQSHFSSVPNWRGNLQLLYLPSSISPPLLPPLAVHPSFCHSLISPAAPPTSYSLPHLSFALPLNAARSPPPPRFPFTSLLPPLKFFFFSPVSARLSITPFLPFHLNSPLYSVK